MCVYIIIIVKVESPIEAQLPVIRSNMCTIIVLAYFV